MEPKNMIPRKENFICRICLTKNESKGGLERNHCASCLASMHVDKDIPGDRLSECRGTMEAITVSLKSGKYVITHECNICGKISYNKAAPDDNADRLIKLINAQPILAIA